MDERRLRYFLAIVSEGSVTAAAVKLRVAQPSLSQTLRSFERELGVSLFHRVGRGVHITAAGEALVGPARQALLALDVARSAVREVSELLAGELVIAALATLAVDPLAELIGEFRRTHSQLTVEIIEAESTASAARLVTDGAAELGIVQFPIAGARLATTPLRDQQLLFVLPPGSTVTDHPLGPAALGAIPLIVTPPGTSTRVLLEQAFADAGIVPNIAVQTSTREAIVPLVLAGAGAALLPPALARQAKEHGAIVRSAHPAIRRQIGLISRFGPGSPAAREFAAMTTRATTSSSAAGFSGDPVAG